MDQKQEELSRYVEIWSKAVDTQMHFNEMSVKSRQLGLAFVSAALGIAVVLLAKGEDFALVVTIGGLAIKFHISVFLVIAALIAIHAVQTLDLNVYHRMLRGAVTFNEDFEENYMKKIFELDKGMTQSVSHFSRFQDATTARDADGKLHYLGTDKISAEDKIRKFYSTTIRYLWIAAGVLLLFTNIATYGPTPVN